MYPYPNSKRMCRPIGTYIRIPIHQSIIHLFPFTITHFRVSVLLPLHHSRAASSEPLVEERVGSVPVGHCITTAAATIAGLRNYRSSTFSGVEGTAASGALEVGVAVRSNELATGVDDGHDLVAGALGALDGHDSARDRGWGCCYRGRSSLVVGAAEIEDARVGSTTTVLLAASAAALAALVGDECSCALSRVKSATA